MGTKRSAVLLLTLAGLCQVTGRSMATDWNTIDPGYRHASSEALERWRDMKYGLRICWGQYNVWNIEASWPLLQMPNAKKQQYFDLYKHFNPTEFDAEKWMGFAGAWRAEVLHLHLPSTTMASPCTTRRHA